MSDSACVSGSVEGKDGEALSDILSVEHGDVVCFVGGGGKTSLMYSVGHQIRESWKEESSPMVIICTTTTRFVRPQVPHEVDYCLTCDTPEELLEDFLNLLHSVPSPLHPGTQKDEETRHQRGGVILVGACLSALRSADGLEHVRGVDLTWTQRIFSRLTPDAPSSSSRPKVAVLIEADGARMLPFKVPSVSKREPCYPVDTSHIVSVVGVDAYHTILDEKFVCRSKDVALCTGYTLGDIVDAECIGKTMGNPRNWNIPEDLNPRRGYYVCVNKVDLGEGERMEHAKEIALQIHRIGMQCPELYKGVFITGQSKSEKRGRVFESFINQ
eukprot:TRINITY_DN1507_c0_g1_i1.p1 TRINITY_DN1507_c0_g1~~TRINITY_DN1507_c0_g1_i1.p1  ORF type:complete len:328 (+),score=92.19 TRINITY_DN1507_c0_g1_i1:362-1345(+)